MSTFSEKIQEILSLKGPIPRTIAKQLQLDNGLLREIDSNFKALVTDLHIWSFFETVDSDLTNTNLIESDRFPFHAPITSIKSALLNLRHEVVYPLLSDHASCASFDSNNTQTKTSYLGELAHAVKKACELSRMKHTDMKLEDKVQVEINGFYESTVLVDDGKHPPRVWSTNRSLRDFKKLGPARLLEDRLAEVTVAPRETQHLRSNTRAASLLPDRPRDAQTASPDPAFNDPSQSLRIPSSKLNSMRHGRKLRKSKSKERAAGSSTHQNTLSSISAFEAITSALEPTNSRNSISSMLSEEVGPVSSPANAHGITTPGSLPPPVVLEPARDVGLYDVNQLRRHSGVQIQSLLLRPGVLVQNSLPRGRRGSESAINPSNRVLFSKPDVSNQKLVWVHVPFNNPSWVKVGHFITPIAFAYLQ